MAIHNKAKVITFYSTKGGVGKTTSCLNIAAALGKINVKILVIDADPIASLSTNLSFIDESSTIELFLNKGNLNQIIKKNISSNVDVIPTSIDLSFKFNDGLFDEYKENFSHNLEILKKQYDVILIDLSSSISKLNDLVMACSDSILVPLLCNQYSIDSISKTLLVIRNIQTKFNSSLRIEGLFINMFDKRKSESISFLTEINSIFKDDLYNTTIPQDIWIQKSQRNNEILVSSSPWKQAAINFSELANEIYKKINN